MKEKDNVVDYVVDNPATSNAPAGRKSSRNRHPWTEEEDSLLGTKSDRALAKKLGRTITAVAARRHNKHICFIKKWSFEDDNLLGTRPDEQVAMLLKRP